MRARQARGSRRGHMMRREQVARAVADDISRFSLASTLSESAHDSTRAQHTPPRGDNSGIRATQHLSTQHMTAHQTRHLSTCKISTMASSKCHGNVTLPGLSPYVTVIRD
jgi:hypothetical protein